MMTVVIEYVNHNIDLYYTIGQQSIMTYILEQMLAQEYQTACAAPTDIHEHLPMLKNIADRCTTVTEFGVRSGLSTRALLASWATSVRCYDLELNEPVIALVNQCRSLGRDVTYQQANTLNLVIEPTDLLFIDTLHTHDQLMQELRRHSNRVNRYIALHDTHTFGLQDEPGYSGPGLLPALMQWMAEQRSWIINYHSWRNNGFTVIERIC
jgi:hypothetical protein